MHVMPRVYISRSELAVLHKDAILTPCHERKCSRSFRCLLYHTANVPIVIEGNAMKNIARWCLANPAALVLGCDVGCSVKIPK